MEVISSFPTPVAQRVLVAGAAGEGLAGFLDGLAAALDLPLVRAADLAGPHEWARLAAFDGWVSTGEVPGARGALLERAQLVVHLVDDGGSIRKLVRKTVRRIRSEAPAPDLTWVDSLPFSHPELPVVRLAGQADADAWLRRILA